MVSFFKKCHRSQADRILDLFKENQGEKIPLPRILDLRPRIAHHTECIRELRERGHDIECHTYWVDGVHFSEYTYHGISLKPRETHKKSKYSESEYNAGIVKAFNAGLNLEAPNAEAYLSTLK